MRETPKVHSISGLNSVNQKQSTKYTTTRKPNAVHQVHHTTCSRVNYFYYVRNMLFCSFIMLNCWQDIYIDRNMNIFTSKKSITVLQVACKVV